MCKLSRDISTPKIIVISNIEKKDLVMSDVSSVVETILRITLNIRSTRIYKRKYTILFL
jgi:hypothetical protein